MKPSVLIGLALAALAQVPAAAGAQDRARGPRWERPGFDISRDGGWRLKARAVAAERARLLSRGEFGRLNAPRA
ncbi:MAG TPA: hypothetical protein VNI61_10015, partial [Gemmatimonadales bacterium]|nr:hypothetical protein [Gemmatimonadales bacterium]